MARDAEPQPGVLIVEGEVLVRHALADYLRDCGFTVIEAATTTEALVALEETGLRIDAVLCDARAPGAPNAFELCRRVPALAHRRGVKMILAGGVETAAREAADLCDQGPRLARPYDPQGVVSHIRRLLGLAGPGNGA